jgi:hypothetical protein
MNVHSDQVAWHLRRSFTPDGSLGILALRSLTHLASLGIGLRRSLDSFRLASVCVVHSTPIARHLRTSSTLGFRSLRRARLASLPIIHLRPFAWHRPRSFTCGPSLGIRGVRSLYSLRCHPGPSFTLRRSLGISAVRSLPSPRTSIRSASFTPPLSLGIDHRRPLGFPRLAPHYVVHLRTFAWH